MRTLTDHKQDGCNEALNIEVLDIPGSGGANHYYRITGYRRRQEVVANSETGSTEIIDDVATDIRFQNGTIKEAGVNGITQEALLAVVIDRLRGFQSGQFACRENEQALLSCEAALMWLQKRTADRLRRGVEGTHQA